MTRRRHSRQPGWAAVALCVLGHAMVLSVVAATQAREEYLGGDTTVVDDGPTAFGRALANLDQLRWNELRAGKERFHRQWAQRGRWADAGSCADCHHHDGRGPRPDAGSGLAHLIRLGHGSPGGDPVYGVQLRRIGDGVPAPASFDIHWQETPHRYPSGEVSTLRRPAVKVTDLSYGPLDPHTRMSLRVPPAVFGLGLLEAVAEDEIRRWSDAGDADVDGISGKVQQVRDAATGRVVVGRFGWKASNPSLAAQSTAALLADLGVRVADTSRVVGRGSGVVEWAAGVDADAARHRSQIDAGDLGLLVGYLRGLAVPARRRWTEPAVRQGEALFASIGCAACHRPQVVTGELPGWPELTNQAIRPYTDLLLHDMGPELADEVEEGVASGREWRTPPLWGLGLVPIVSRGAGLLHDGRARSPEEAILWHAGEAEGARERFRHLPPRQRAALIAFLDTL